MGHVVDFDFAFFISHQSNGVLQVKEILALHSLQIVTNLFCLIVTVKDGDYQITHGCLLLALTGPYAAFRFPGIFHRMLSLSHVAHADFHYG
jgi:hypothetical protein